MPTGNRKADYFSNHDRRRRFPWSLYHGPLLDHVDAAIRRHKVGAHVLVVGCGAEPLVPGAPAGTIFWGCDIDERAVERCRREHPQMADRLAVCPGPYELPSPPRLRDEFDLVIAKEVVEHLDDPARWARALAARVALGGELVLTTPNYGRASSLALIESTVLEWVARRDGFSRAHIHPSRFNARTLASLDVGRGMRLMSVRRTWTAWALVASWQRVARL